MVPPERQTCRNWQRRAGFGLRQDGPSDGLGRIDPGARLAWREFGRSPCPGRRGQPLNVSFVALEEPSGAGGHPLSFSRNKSAVSGRLRSHSPAWTRELAAPSRAATRLHPGASVARDKFELGLEARGLQGSPNGGFVALKRPTAARGQRATKRGPSAQGLAQGTSMGRGSVAAADVTAAGRAGARLSDARTASSLSTHG